MARRSDPRNIYNARPGRRPQPAHPDATVTGAARRGARSVAVGRGRVSRPQPDDRGLLGRRHDVDRRAARTVGRPRLTGAGAAGVRRGDRGTQQVGSPDDRSLTDLGASSHASTKQNSAPRIAAFGQLPNGGGNLDCGARPYREGFGGRPARWGFVMSARASELRGPGRRPSRCYDG